MVENQESDQSKENGIGRRSLGLLVAVALGGFVGAIFFPTVETKLVEKRVEVPVEVVKYVDRVVEKRVEIPVDRVVEKIVVQRVEIPGPEREVVRYVSDRTQQANGKPTYVMSEERINLWKQIKKGMTRKQVVEILGPPDGEPNSSYDGVFFHWGKGSVFFETMSSGGVVKFVTPPEF
jgi:hypothetical protein